MGVDAHSGRHTTDQFCAEGKKVPEKRDDAAGPTEKPAAKRQDKPPKKGKSKDKKPKKEPQDDRLLDDAIKEAEKERDERKAKLVKLGYADSDIKQAMEESGLFEHLIAMPDSERREMLRARQSSAGASSQGHPK